MAPQPTPTPDSAALLASTLGFANTHYAREDWLAARDFLSLAVEIAPHYPRLLGALGSLQFQLHEYPAACITFSAAVRRNPDDPDLHIQLAMVHLKLEHLEAAEAALNCALELRPDDPTALKLLADSKRDQGRYQEAGAIYGKLINQHPDQVGVFLSLAKCFFKRGDREGTQAALEFVLTLDPNNEIARENLMTLQATGARKQIPAISSFVQSSPVHQSDMDNSTAAAVPRSTLNSVKAMVRRLAAMPSLFGDVDALSMPQYIIFTASTVCNLRCPHCWTHGTPEARQHHNNRKSDLPREILLNIASESLPFASEFSLTMSGEPLLLPDFENLVTSLVAWGARLNLVTNGTCLRPSMIAAILPQLSNVSISIDGAFAPTFERLRLGAKFGTFLSNVRVLTRSLEYLPELPRPGLCLAFTSMGSNMLELPQVVRLASLLKIPNVHSTPIKIAAGQDDISGEDMQYHWPQFARSAERARQLAASLDINLCVSQPDGVAPVVPLPDRSKAILKLPSDDDVIPEENVDHLLSDEGIDVQAQEVVSKVRQCKLNPMVSVSPAVAERIESLSTTEERVREKYSDRHREWRSTGNFPSVYRCMSLEKHMYVSQDGEVLPCCTAGLPHFGNALRESIYDIWNGEAYRKFRRQFHSETPPAACAKCVYRKKVSAIEVVRASQLPDNW